MAPNVDTRVGIGFVRRGSPYRTFIRAVTLVHYIGHGQETLRMADVVSHLTPRLTTPHSMHPYSFSRRRRALLLIAAVAAIPLAGCGGGASIDDDGVAAVVDGQTITSEQVADAVKGALPLTAGTAVELDAPKFTKCAAAMRKVAKTPADAAVEQCKVQYATARNQALQTLVTRKWIALAAEDAEISISDAELDKAVKARVAAQKAAGDDAAAIPEGQMRDIVRNELLTTRLFTVETSKPTDAQMRAWYEKNGERLARPASRDLELIRLSSRAKAQAAYDQIAGGSNFKQVARASRYAAPVALPGVTEQALPPALGQAVFGAVVGRLAGPVKVGSGEYVVFRVTDTDAPQDKPAFAKAKTQIAAMLASEMQGAATSKRNEEFQETWKAKTECAKGYRAPVCGNVETPKTSSPASSRTSTAATTAPPIVPPTSNPQMP